MVRKKEVVKGDVKSKKRAKASRNFVVALSIVSIIGFFSIVMSSLFYIDISKYIDTLWLMTLGLGLILETSIREIKKIKKIGMTPEILGEITMLIVGGMAIIAGILSLPQINIQNPSFLAVSSKSG